MKLKAVYRINELAALAGVTTRRMRTDLTVLGVVIHRDAGQRTGRVYLTDLERLAPDLIRSIALKREVEEGQDEAKDPLARYR